MPIIPTINTDEYVSGNSAPAEDDADADNDIVIDEPEKSEEAESEESEKDEAPAEAVESDAKDSATDELITAFANEPEFSEETATPDEIVPMIYSSSPSEPTIHMIPWLRQKNPRRIPMIWMTIPPRTAS